MTQRVFTSVCVLTMALLMGVATIAEAQIGGLLRRAKSAADDAVAAEIEKLVRDGVRCAFQDEQCIREARAEGKTPIMTDDAGNLITDDKGRPLTDPDEAAAKLGRTAGPGRVGQLRLRPG
jgi:hypothetical protein